MNIAGRILICCVGAALLMGCSSDRPATALQVYPTTNDKAFLTRGETLGEVEIPENGFWQKFKLIFVDSQDMPTLSRPTGIAISSNGDVFIVDADAGQVLRYHYENEELVSIEPFGMEVLISPRGITLSESAIFVSDQTLGEIVKFDHHLTVLDVLEIDGLDRPGQIKFNPRDKTILIIDTPGHQVIIADTTGNIKASLGITMQGEAVLKSPVALDITPDGSIVVLDGLTRRVEFFAPDYHYLSGFGKYDKVPGSFAYPRGLAVSSDGFVFVCDAAFGNVQIFNQDGVLLYFWGEVGQAPGEFLLPSFLIFDDQNILYVADQYNSRIQTFHYVPLDN